MKTSGALPVTGKRAAPKPGGRGVLAGVLAEMLAEVLAHRVF